MSRLSSIERWWCETRASVRRSHESLRARYPKGHELPKSCGPCGNPPFGSVTAAGSTRGYRPAPPFRRPGLPIGQCYVVLCRKMPNPVKKLRPVIISKKLLCEGCRRPVGTVDLVKYLGADLMQFDWHLRERVHFEQATGNDRVTLLGDAEVRLHRGEALRAGIDMVGFARHPRGGEGPAQDQHGRPMGRSFRGSVRLICMQGSCPDYQFDPTDLLTIPGRAVLLTATGLKPATPAPSGRQRSASAPTSAPG